MKYLIASLIILAGLVVAAFNTEIVQKKIHDKKADLIGTDRTVTFYSQLSNERLKVYSDKEMRIDLEQQGQISLWLGTKKQKVVSNLPYIVEDTIKNGEK